MSTGTWSNDSLIGTRTVRREELAVPYLILRALGSLKITVAMFGLGILLLLFGTLAQDQQNLAEVKRLYFNAWLSIIPVDVLFPITIFPHNKVIPGVFPFPGGATIGLILMINLIAAKATRFAVHSKGAVLSGGIVVSLLGAALVAAVIISGHAADGLQGKPPISYDSLWALMRGGFVIITLAAIAYAAFPRAKTPRLMQIFSWVCAGTMLALTVALLAGGSSMRLNDPGLRIVWQLLQAGIASFVCLIGLSMIFGRRGGNVLIHAGIGLMMVGQFVFGDRQVEQRLSLAEGSSTNLVFQQDELEIAVIDTSDEKEDAVVAIPEALLRRAVRSRQEINSAELPFRIKIVHWYANSRVKPNRGETSNEANLGSIGKEFIAEAAQTQGGAMQGSNIASAYVQIIPKSGGEAIGTVLLTQYFNDQAQLFMGTSSDRNERITVDGKPYELALRFRREYKPYMVTLKDVERIDYSGSETPRDYSSTIVITDTQSGTTQEGRTWMNNPIRYRGETFYQSNYNRDRNTNLESTGLQVVENSGWVIPYVTCMMVLVGMLSHFGGTFLTFSSRYDRGVVRPTLDDAQPTGNETKGKSSATTETRPRTKASTWALVAPALVGVGLVGIVAAYYAKPNRTSLSMIDWHAISQLPMQHEGRIKPMDTVAKNVLQVISEPVFGGTPYVKDLDDKKHTPTEWLMGVITNQEWALKAPVFRVYAQEVRDVFELPPRAGYRYSYSELEPKREKFRNMLAPLRDKESEEFTPTEQKLVAMNSKLNLFDLVTFAYQLPNIPDVSKAGESEEARQQFTSALMQTLDAVQRLEAGHPPAIIPPAKSEKEDANLDKWQAYGPAFFAAYVENLVSPERVEPNPAILAFTDILDALRKGNSSDINKAVASYKKTIEANPAVQSKMAKTRAEVWLNKFNPTGQAIVFYLFAIVLAFASLMTRWDFLRKATFWMLVATFVIHSVAIVSRIYISGRPPVINLYSSAVFIGWATAILGLILESIFPIGVSNLAVALIGAITLSVARSLDNNDTMHVLQAVLDTQFWLSTHVVTVTYGYAATYLAGFLGIMALVHRIYHGGRLGDQQKRFQDIVYRMNYGVVCFGLFLSFIGTVLGGLWADDSWGRFWGWDPKENGALMIVLWNAIVLHARWDKFVGQRGFALLTVVGNIITTWSWFGVNQLGVGLHSYGNNSSVLAALTATVSVHIAFIAAAYWLTRTKPSIA